MVCIALVDIRIIARFSWVAYAVGVALLLLVLKIGHVGKGAQRWLELGGQQIQPSELMKLGLILALAAWFHRASWERMGNPLFLLPPLIADPDPGRTDPEGTQSGHRDDHRDARWRDVFRRRSQMVEVRCSCWCRCRSPRVMFIEHLHDYQRARIDTFINPESDPLGAGYNIIQSKIALGSGGMWGKGFLQGTQGHLDFLPEKQTDFIFTMIGEEFGLVGAVAVIALLDLDHLGSLADRAALQTSIRPAGRLWDRLQFLLLLLCEYRDGHGGDPGGRCATAADIAWGLGDDHDDGVVWHPDVGAGAPRCGVRGDGERLKRDVRGVLLTSRHSLGFIGECYPSWLGFDRPDPAICRRKWLKR